MIARCSFPTEIPKMSKRTLFELIGGAVICVAIPYGVKQHYQSDPARITLDSADREIVEAEQDVFDARMILKTELSKSAALIAHLKPDGIAEEMQALREARSNLTLKTRRLEHLRAAAHLANK
jgi:hypothetical protein